MTNSPLAPAAASGTSRRTALGLAAAGGVALSAVGRTAEAFAAPPVVPMAPVLPAVIGDLAKGLDLQSSKEWHLARRVCPAPTKAIADEIRKVGYARWIDTQLAWSKISDSKADGLVKKYLGTANMTSKQADKATKERAWIAGKAMSISRTVRHVFTRRYLYESMVDTLADHLYISADGKANEFVAWFDWAVLRKYALGKYSSMLYAGIRHPAMLIHLDNQLNSADKPNENLGRELLELHSVGVGNYTEDDVRASALMLTGHGVDWDRRAYHFSADEHQFGPITVMGFTHPNGTGQGPAALKAYLNYLSHHEATAKHIARRLSTRFVSDTPPDTLINKLAQVYLDNDTALAPVMRALLLSDEFANSVGDKWRRPQETMATMIKLRKPSGLKPSGNQYRSVWDITGTVQWLLYLESHQARMWPVVNGYPDQAVDWMGTQALLGSWDSANEKANDYDKEWPSKSWQTVLGVKKGQVIADVAARLTTNLTGYSWPQAHLDIVIARLKGDEETTTLTSNQVKNYLGPTLHFIFASPYFKLR